MRGKITGPDDLERYIKEKKDKVQIVTGESGNSFRFIYKEKLGKGTFGVVFSIICDRNLAEGSDCENSLIYHKSKQSVGADTQEFAKSPDNTKISQNINQNDSKNFLGTALYVRPEQKSMLNAKVTKENTKEQKLQEQLANFPFNFALKIVYEDIHHVHREVQILQELNHPNILKILDFYEINEKYGKIVYIITESMQYCMSRVIGHDLHGRFVFKYFLGEKSKHELVSSDEEAIPYSYKSLSKAEQKKFKKCLESLKILFKIDLKNFLANENGCLCGICDGLQCFIDRSNDLQEIFLLSEKVESKSEKDAGGQSGGTSSGSSRYPKGGKPIIREPIEEDTQSEGLFKRKSRKFFQSKRFEAIGLAWHEFLLRHRRSIMNKRAETGRSVQKSNLQKDSQNKIVKEVSTEKQENRTGLKQESSINQSKILPSKESQVDGLNSQQHSTINQCDSIKNTSCTSTAQKAANLDQNQTKIANVDEMIDAAAKSPDLRKVCTCLKVEKSMKDSEKMGDNFFCSYCADAQQKAYHKIHLNRDENDLDSSQTESLRAFTDIIQVKLRPEIVFAENSNEYLIEKSDNTQEESMKITYCFNIYQSLLRKIKQIILKERLTLVIHQKTFSALTYLHSKNICHRDIKPSNILISFPLIGQDKNKDTKKSTNLLKNGKFNLMQKLTEFVSVRICDFGNAKTLAARNTSYVCSRYYRPPECIVLSPFYTNKIDVWSLGVSLLELHTRRPVFLANENIKMLDKFRKIFELDQKEIESLRKNPKISNPRNEVSQRVDLSNEAKKELNESISKAKGMEKFLKGKVSETGLADTLKLSIVINPNERSSSKSVLDRINDRIEKLKGKHNK